MSTVLNKGEAFRRQVEWGGHTQHALHDKLDMESLEISRPGPSEYREHFTVAEKLVCVKTVRKEDNKASKGL